MDWLPCKTVWLLLKKVNTDLPNDTASPRLGTHAQRTRSMIPKRCWPTHVTKEWGQQMWCMNTGDYCSTLKKKGFLTPATRQMGSADIILGDVNQSQKDT